MAREILHCADGEEYLEHVFGGSSHARCPVEQTQPEILHINR